MNKQKVIDALKEKYPGKNILALPDDETAEILCEIDPSMLHPEYSVAVSVIDKSDLHYHKESTETYKVLEGELDLFIDGVPHHLKQGDSMVIKPYSYHYAVGNETWIECKSEPGWTVKDHLLVKEVTPKDTRYVPLTQQKWCCVPTCIQMVMLRHQIPLVPAERLGYEMGLVVPNDATKYFWNARTSPRPPAGYGTQVGKPQYGPNAVFKELKIPFKMSLSLINKFKTIDSFKKYLSTAEESNKDILVCYDWPTLFDPKGKEHWGHVCVLDKVYIGQDKVRIMDPDVGAPKWRVLNIPDLYKAMVFHGNKKSGGFWEIAVLEEK